MKSYCLLFTAILLLSACGTDTSQKSTSMPIDYFSKPVSMVSTATDVTGAVQASNLTLFGVNRSNTEITLSLSVDIANSSADPQRIYVNISGKDAGGQTIITPAVVATVLPNETRTVETQQQFFGTYLVDITTWEIVSITPAPPELPVSEFPNELPSGNPIMTTGGVELSFIVPNKTNKEYRFYNNSTVTQNFHFSVNGLTETDVLVFTRDINTSIPGHDGLHLFIGPETAISEADFAAITKWNVTDFSRY